MGLVGVRRALVSVSDKTGVVAFAESLRRHGVEIISTGGTARTLREAGLDVTPIESVTGFPEMMDGRVKTLHPKIHGGLLARRDDESHVEAMRLHGIQPIDLVCVNLYPFEQTVATPGVTPEEAIEQIDIGGPSMVRSAAKNHRFITIVTSPRQYGEVIAELDAHGGATRLELRARLAAAAFERTAAYDAAIARWMAAHAGTAEPWPARLLLTYTKVDELRYGENPHQPAAVYRDPSWRGPGVVQAEQLHGKALSYNNLNDAAAALSLVQEFDQPAAAVIKHTNPCGCAIGDTIEHAMRCAYEGDPLAAFGGIAALNRPVDLDAAEFLCDGQKFLEVIVAPRFEPEALERLRARWANVRLLAVGDGRPASTWREIRSIPGGLIVQEADRLSADVSSWRHAAGPAPTDQQRRDAAVAWIVGKHLKSNAIAIGGEGRLYGAGAGQMDRVTACRLAVEKAGERARGAVAASDAFFPFDDGPRVLIDAGVTLIVHPGGSKRDDDTVRLCHERGVTLLLTGVRHFRH